MSSETPFELVCCAGTHDSLLYYYLTPVARHPLVTKVWIVRAKRSEYGDVPKATYCLTSARSKPLRFAQMYRECCRLLRRPQVKACVSFNPFPYGLISMLAAQRHRKPVHFGFIGDDWYRDATGSFGRLLNRYIRRADFVTGTGQGMLSEMAHAGVDRTRLAVLPHCIDVERFPVADPDRAEFDFVFCGELIRRKRVDVVLRAFAEVVRHHSTARLCVVGTGPLEHELRDLASQLGIAGNTLFTGYSSDVNRWLANARILVMASEREGFPFAIVEAICTGLVTVTTPVGTIGDDLHDEQTALFYPVGDHRALSDRLRQLLERPEFYQTLRTNSLSLRQRYSYDSATEIWAPWLRSLIQPAPFPSPCIT